METLLAKTRRVNRLIQRSAGYPVDFDEMAETLREVVGANVYVVSKRGKILGHALLDDMDCEYLREDAIEPGRFPEDYNDRLLNVREARANISEEDETCTLRPGDDCVYPGRLLAVIPIDGGGERLGTLLLSRMDREFTDEDLVIGEFGATIVGIEILRAKSSELEEEARKRAAVQIAIGTLSFSELEALGHIFGELKGTEGLLIASKIADRVGITRSVIVNALRKLESAGVIESRSLGMKGTHIRILNDLLLDELKRVRAR